MGKPTLDEMRRRALERDRKWRNTRDELAANVLTLLFVVVLVLLIFGLRAIEVMIHDWLLRREWGL